MKDKILENLTASFANDFSLSGEAEPTVFEHFVNYCIVSKYSSEEVDLDVIHTGGDGDPSIDGIAVIVNGHIVTDPEEVNDIKRHSPRMEIDFIFIQAKTSSKFESGDILGFMHGVSEFLDGTAVSARNKAVRNQMEIRDAVIGALATTHRNPVCHMFFVTTGQWKDEPLLIGRIERQKEELRATNLFSSVEFYPVDSVKLQGLHRQLRHKIECSVDFPKRTALPAIAGVQEAYIGVLRCKEYLKLITDDDGSMRRHIFYENVRDFLGENPVNAEIETTLQDHERQQHFALLNNGVTIIARAMVPRADVMSISDYQIVNGCQTSNVLFRNREELKEDTSLPVRLIVTEDSVVIGEIVKATNRQTEVKIEAFEALSAFHRKLEEFYEAMRNTKQAPLYYERRSRQYSNLQIIQRHIVTLPGQVKAFLAMFLEEPHSTHRYYGELIKSYRARLFQEDHRLSPYFASALALKTLDELLQTCEANASFRKFRYHLALAFRIAVGGPDVPKFNSHDAERLGERLVDVCLDSSQAKQKYQEACDILTEVLDKYGSEDAYCDRTRAFTEDLIATASGRKVAARSQTTQTCHGEKRRGKVKIAFPTRGFGFVAEENSPQDPYFHFTFVEDPHLRSLLEDGRGHGLDVEYSQHRTDRGLEAHGLKMAVL